jgi:WD40 repeat protein
MVPTARSVKIDLSLTSQFLKAFVMMRHSLLLASAFILAIGLPARSEGPAEGPRPKQPVLRVEAGGPTAFVTSLAFSPDGRTLYAAGFDKVVRVWTLDSKSDRFELSSTSYRVPIGPGLEGVINSIALSPDGAWLAVGGSALFRDRADFGETGHIVSRKGGMTKAMLLDRGTIFAFNTKTGEMKRLRGHEGVVLSLTFADKGSILVSAGRDKAEDQENKYVGAIRVWDLNTADGAPLRLGADLPDPVYYMGKGKQFVTRPGLAAWRVGDGPKEVRVAISADDPKNGALRLWDVAKGLLWDDGQDGVHNNAVAYKPSTGKLYTGSFRNPTGHVQAWNVRRPGGSVPSAGIRLATGAFVRDLSLCSVPGNEKLSHAAVVLRLPGRGDEVRLQMLDLINERTVGDSILLWSESADQPVLATSPNGNHLAVAGNRDHSIHVFAIKDLLAGKAEPAQKLRSVGAVMHQIAFVKKGKDRGIVLRQSSAKANQGIVTLQEGDLIFDISNRTLSQDVKEWVLDGVKERSSDEADLVKKLKLSVNGDATAIAYLPAQAPHDVPLLAVSLDELGETQLRLYNAQSFEQFRLFTGHVNTIRSLAFSADGKLLASTGDDQTVCLWSLTDLAESLGRQGQITGMSVQLNKQGKMVISDLDNATLLPGNRKEMQDKEVQPDDMIEGVVVNGQLKKLATAQDFYLTMASVKPLEKVTLRMAGRGDIALAASQGIDERKPLFSLFFTQNLKTKQWDWLGWSPLGPFDTSDRKVERLVGWHQNLGDAENKLVRFSHVEEFRKDNFKPGILKDLIDYGNAGQAIDAYQRRIPQPPREPRMSLGVVEDEDILGSDEQGRYLVQLKQVTLTLNLSQKPSGKVKSIVWEMGGTKGTFAPAAGDSWNADLSAFPWKRGENKVRIELRTEAPVAGPFTRELTFLYQPAKPTIAILSSTPRVVDTADYLIRALITPGRGQNAQARLLHKEEGQEAKEKQKQSFREKAGEIKETLVLKPGINQIQIVAKNEASTENDASDIVSQTIEVLYKSKQPLITFEALELPNGSKRVIELGKTIEIDSPSIKIKGQIGATENLALANWIIGDAKEAKPIDGFKPDQKQISFGQAFTLEKPGEPTTITFVAKAANSEEVKRSVTVSFRPKLPAITLVSPALERVLYEGKDKSAVPVEAALTWPDAAFDCQAQIMVNGKPQGAPLAVAAKSPKVSAEAHLESGNNEIAVQLTNKWQKEPQLTRKALIVFRRPPRIVAFKQTATSDKPPRIAIEGIVETPNDLPLTRAVVSSWRLRRDGLAPTQSEIRVRQIEINREDAKKGAQLATWILMSADIPVDEGKNQVRLMVENQDGECMEAKNLTAIYMKPVEPKAEIMLLDPTDDKTVKAPDYTFRFAVRSKSSLRKVTLIRDNEALLDAKVSGIMNLEETKTVKLNKGFNKFYVLAANEGGEQVSRPVVINYQYSPVVRIVLDRLENGKDISRSTGEPRDGQVPFQRVQAGRQTLVGFVEWDKENDEPMAKTTHIRVFANGQQLIPVKLLPANAGERRRKFQAEVELVLGENNQVVVRLPYMPLDASSHKGLLVACAHPEPARTYAHLLILSREEEKKDEARDHALKGLKATLGEKNSFTMPGFPEGQIYGPLVSAELTPERVFGLLRDIRNNLRRRANAGKTSDAVLVYYRGGESITGRGNLLTLAGDATDAESSTIGLDYIASLLDQNQGSRIWLLDTIRDQKDDDIASDPTLCNDLVANCDDPNSAMWRYAWQGKASDQPKEARLLANLPDALSQAGRLTDVSKGLGATFTKPPGEKLPWTKYSNHLLYNFYLAPGLSDWSLEQ